MSKSLSTYDRLIKDKYFKEEFDKSYKEFLLKELRLLLTEIGNKNE